MKKDKIIQLIKEELVEYDTYINRAAGAEVIASEHHGNLLIEKHSNRYITLRVDGRSNSMLNLGKDQDFKTLMKVIVDVSKRK